MNTQTATGTIPLFEIGQVVATPRALIALSRQGDPPQVALGLLHRHAHGDWGFICDEDAEANLQATRDDLRIISVYRVAGQDVWLITEADRSATTLLLPEEY